MLKRTDFIADRTEEQRKLTEWRASAGRDLKGQYFSVWLPGNQVQPGSGVFVNLHTTTCILGHNKCFSWLPFIGLRGSRVVVVEEGSYFHSGLWLARST